MAKGEECFCHAASGALRLDQMQACATVAAMVKDPNLKDAYAVSSQDGLRTLYREWAHSYDSGFGDAQGYQLPREVAQAFIGAGGIGPVLDVGAGTGLVAEHLAQRGVTEIDALDFSEDMLSVARSKGIYRELFAADITKQIDIAAPLFAGVVSAGTFTMGHVGPEGIVQLLPLAAKGALFVISVNAAFYKPAGFAAHLERLEGKITGLTLADVRIYDDRAEDSHRSDMSRLVMFRKV